MTPDKPLSKKTPNKPKEEKSLAEPKQKTESLRDETRKKLIASGYPEEVISKDLPDDSDEKGKRLVSALSISYSGLLPPPGMLKQYFDISSKTGERIIQLAEENHRRIMNRSDNLANTDNTISLRTQMLPFIIVLIIVLAAVIIGPTLIILGHKIFGYIFTAGPLITLATFYITREFEHRSKPEK